MSERLAAPTGWHIITSEYPPATGGVSDYTKLIATELAQAGEDVHVWCPSWPGYAAAERESISGGTRGPFVHRELGLCAPADLRRVGHMLDQFAGPRRLLLQWVPQGYGYRSMNLALCLWLGRRARSKQDQLEIMIHEPFLAFGEGSRKQDLAAAVHRLMIFFLLRAASRVWVSIPDWGTRLRPFVVGEKSFGWLPVPSTIPVINDPDGIVRVRARYGFAGVPLVGHFGAYDLYMTRLMLEVLPRLLNGPDKLSVVLLGRGSLELREQLISRHPDLAPIVHATGSLTADDLSRHVSACDVMLQPYQDGVSGRRTSAMTALAHGVPIVTTPGKATETCWVASEAVKLTRDDSFSAIGGAIHSLLADTSERHRLSAAGKALYAGCFDVKNTIAALRGQEYNTSDVVHSTRSREASVREIIGRGSQ